MDQANSQQLSQDSKKNSKERRSILHETLLSSIFRNDISMKSDTQTLPSHVDTLMVCTFVINKFKQV
jgi:hypothetical protein